MRTMRYSLTLALGFLLNVSLAQVTTTHPLSSYGIGEYNSGSNGITAALGDVNSVWIDSSNINFFNPSSYSRLSKGNTLLALGLESRFSFYNQQEVSEFRTATNFNYFSLAFKSTKKSGFAFGLKPYSNVGYEFSESLYTGLDSIRYTYSGGGNIQDAYLGFSYAPIANKRTHLSLGANVSYLFGFVSNERKSELLNADTDQGGLSQDLTRLASFHYQLGLHFEQTIGKRHTLLLGFTIDPEQSFGGSIENSLYTSANINAPSLYDTIFSSNTSGSVKAMTSYEMGFKYKYFFKETKRKSTTRRPNITFAASYKLNMGIESDFEEIQNWSIGSSNSICLGLSYSPETMLFQNVATLKLMEKLNYRVGYFQRQLPSNGQFYVDRGTTFGIGIPILAQMSLSSLNLAFVLGQKGTGQSDSLKEQYIGFKFGMVFSPSNFEKWFRKRKLD